MSLIAYNPEVQEYLQLNNFSRIDADTLQNGMVFKRGDDCIVFSGNSIELRKPYMHTNPCNIAAILFDWKLVKKFSGFDGQNIFHLMLLLDIMGVLPINAVKKLAHMDPDRINRIATAPQLNMERCQP